MMQPALYGLGDKGARGLELLMGNGSMRNLLAVNR